MGLIDIDEGSRENPRPVPKKCKVGEELLVNTRANLFYSTTHRKTWFNRDTTVNWIGVGDGFFARGFLLILAGLHREAMRHN